MIIKNYLFILAFLMPVLFTGAQSIPATPGIITTGTYLGLSKPLRELPVMSASDWKAMAKRARKELNEGLQKRSYPYAATALPKGNDTVYQKIMGRHHNLAGQIVNFDGQTSPYYPPDCNGTAGPNHFMQTINMVYAIYTKDGTKVAGPTAINLLFGNVPGANYNDGDPVILYDEQADRWLVTEIVWEGSPNYLLLAVSSTNDPTGTWHRYSFPVASMPDYAKVGIWRDGYYMGDNNGGSTDIYVFQRDSILTGATARMVGFQNPWRPGSVDGFMCVPPVDNDGQFAPDGSPGLYIAFNDDAFGGGSDQLWIYELHVDWNTPGNSTFNRVQQLNVQPFSSNFGSTWDNVPQKGTSQKLDAIPQVIMNVPQYRNFGSYQTIVCCHTINLGTPPNNNHAGIRWYELRKGSGQWSIRQQGTYAPDSNSRWMGSIMLNGSNAIALGYSVSNTTMYPSVRYCGQSPMAYSTGNSTLDIAEDTIITGQHSQSGYNRWGDYSLMSVDPADDTTFWFCDEYIGTGGSRKTRIASFRFAFPPTVTTNEASNVSGVSATLNGTVNPNGVTATGNFYWGLMPLNLNNTTPVDTVGSGNSPIPVESTISGLTPNTVYYYRAVGSNSMGLSYGPVLSFTTIIPALAITPPNRNVEDTTGQTNFLVTSNVSWNVTSDATWCTPTASGSGDDTIYTTYTSNTSTAQRIATLTVNGPGVSAVSVTVTQAGQPPSLIVTPPNRDVDIASASTSFTVLSNTGWNVSSDATWCTVTPSGIGNGAITANFSENQMAIQRIAHITTIAGGAGPVVVTVTQEGASPFLAVTPSSQSVTSAAGSTYFNVNSNAIWTALSDSNWCTVTPSGTGSGTLVANYTVNSANILRTAHIEVTATGLSPQTVTVIQAKSNGVDEANAGGIKIYPNPNKGIFSIVPSEGTREELDVTVEDMNGKTILKKNFKGETEYKIDLSNATAGTFNIIIMTSTCLVTRKVVVIR
jgi:hypothetical protein